MNYNGINKNISVIIITPELQTDGFLNIYYSTVEQINYTSNMLC